MAGVGTFWEAGIVLSFFEGRTTGRGHTLLTHIFTHSSTCLNRCLVFFTGARAENFRPFTRGVLPLGIVSRK